MQENEIEESGGGPVRVLDFWPEGRVWFRESFPSGSPWADEGMLDPVPADAAGSYGVKLVDYATVDGERYQPGEIVVVDSREALRQLTAQLGRVEGLILPWYDRIVPPALWIPYQRTIDRETYRREIGPAWVKAFLISVAGVVVAFVYPQFLILALIAATHFGLFPLVRNTADWFRRVDLFSVDQLNERLVNGELFRRWLLGRSTLTIKIAIGILAVVFVGQLWVDQGSRYPETPPSIAAAALMKPEVTQGGEWWRLVTTGLMHGSLLHIAFNGIALFSLGRVVAALVSPALLSIVFLIAVVTGSLASIYLGPPNPSVGASGGILGCLGFLLVVNRKFSDVIPAFLNTSLIQSTIVIAIFGLIGSMFIDNAAHAGGFIGGVLFGILSYPWLRLGAIKAHPVLSLGGSLSCAVLLAGVVKVFLELSRIAPG